MNEEHPTEESIICSFCGKTSDEFEYVVTGPNEDAPYICNECIRQCEALAAERNVPDAYFHRILGKRHNERQQQLRPITRIPKTWIICDADLFCSTPNIVASSPDGEKIERFSIPKQLAHWMIVQKQKLDVDELREKIRDDMARTVREVLSKY